MNIIFFGSDDFAAINLEALLKDGRDVPAVVTPPDRPKGRGMKPGISPVKEIAGRKNIPVLQPEDIRQASFIKALKASQADLFVVIAYGKILPQSLLDIPRICSVNVHASLLPKYRGAAPINWAIINGEKETGVSVIRLNKCMDAGDIILQRKMTIKDEDTAVTLRVKLALLGADSLIEAVDILAGGQKEFIKQNDSAATFAPKLSKESGHIDWHKPAEDIHNLIRGLMPWPSAYTYCHGKLLKVLAAQRLSEEMEISEPGILLETGPKGMIVSTGSGQLLITRVHPEASRPMDAANFILGHRLQTGCRFD